MRIDKQAFPPQGRKLDHLGRGADFYKALRGQSCALFTVASFAGLLFAIWANEVWLCHQLGSDNMSVLSAVISLPDDNN